MAHYDGVTVMKLKTGFRLYSLSVKDRLYYSVGAYPFTTGLMKCLWKMKIITKAQMDEHIANVQRREEESSKKYARDFLQKTAQKYGFKLTKAQLARLAWGD